MLTWSDHLSRFCLKSIDLKYFCANWTRAARARPGGVAQMVADNRGRVRYDRRCERMEFGI